MIEYLRVRRTFTVHLAPLEISALDADARKKIINADKAEQDRLAKVSEATDLRKRVKGLNAEALAHARAAALGKVERSIECEWRPAEHAERMELHRLDLAPEDAKRIVDHRPMTDAEKRGVYTGEVAASATVGASDSAAANNGAAKKKGKPAKVPEACPATINEPAEDDPTQDKLCGQPCDARKVACAEHLDGMKASDKVHWIARRGRREYLIAERAKVMDASPAVNGHAAGEQQDGAPAQA